MLHRSLRSCLGIIGMLMAIQASASISLSSTRIIFDGTQKEANITVRNGSQNVLIQSWVDGAQANAPTVPFAVTPPLAKMLANEHQLLRILFAGTGLPTDRESVFWLNVQEIPQASTKVNVLQLAVRQRIKIFFRPANLPGDARQAPEQLEWQLTDHSGKIELRVNNPSRYHVSMADIELQDGSRSKSIVKSTMIAPGALETFALNSQLSDKTLRLTFGNINDYGVKNEYNVTVNRTGTSNARIIAPLPSP